MSLGSWSINRNTPMEAKRLEERLGTVRLEDTSTASVQAIFRQRSKPGRRLASILARFRLALAAAVLIVLAAGFGIGGGF